MPPLDPSRHFRPAAVLVPGTTLLVTLAALDLSQNGLASLGSGRATLIFLVGTVALPMLVSLPTDLGIRWAERLKRRWARTSAILLFLILACAVTAGAAVAAYGGTAQDERRAIGKASG